MGRAAGSGPHTELSWSYSLDRRGTSLVSRGVGVRVGAAAAVTPEAAVPVQQQQQQQQQPGEMSESVLLQAGEELWASSQGGELWSTAVEQHGHWAPLVWWLREGAVPAGLAHVNMR